MISVAKPWSQILSTEREDSEAAYRALVALGNVVSPYCSIFVRPTVAHICTQAYATTSSSNPLSGSQSEQAKQAVTSLATTFSEDRIKVMATAVRGLL